MRIGYKILRAFIVTLIVVPPVFAVAIYILLSLPWAQNAMRDIAEKELSAVLGTDLHIGDVSFFPFDGLSISDVSVNDDFGEQALSVKQISAGIDLSRLISGGKIVIDYAAIKGLKAKIYKSSDSTEINIAGIIRRLQSTDKSKSSGKFELKINTFVIDDADLSYDILDSPSSADCRFDPRHIRIQSLDAAANLPSISNDSIIVQLYTLNFKERSGFILSNIKTTLTITPDKIHILDTSIKFPNSTLNIGNSSFSQKTLNDIIVRHDNSLLDSIFIPVEIKDGSHLTPADFKAFIPSLASADFPFYINICA
ncbi:MAG: AsmA family protein, partial [Muribaculaceae bacterium]|nr:AsmA family protein [Muribaculaceae bacterium]